MDVFTDPRCRGRAPLDDSEVLDRGSVAKFVRLPGGALTAFDVLALAAVLVIVGVWIYGGVLALPYFGDDYHHLQVIAEIRAGFRPTTDLLVAAPFGEHIQVLYRFMVWLGSLAGDFHAAPLRTMLLVVHGLGAIAAAGLVFCWSRSRPAAWFAGLLYFGLSD